MDGIWGVSPPRKFCSEFSGHPLGVENGVFSTWVCMISIGNIKTIHPKHFLTHFDPKKPYFQKLVVFMIYKESQFKVIPGGRIRRGVARRVQGRS